MPEYVKKKRIKTFESWEAEEFNQGVPSLPVGRYTYREVCNRAWQLSFPFMTWSISAAGILNPVSF